MILQGYRCTCREHHYQNAAYYVSVSEDGTPERAILALGPFAEHDEALALVDPLSAHVQDEWNPHGRACWYAFGTIAMTGNYKTPGKCNDSFATWQAKRLAPPPPPPARRKRRRIVARIPAKQCPDCGKHNPTTWETCPCQD